MSHLIDLTGQKFNRLLVVSRDNSKSGTYWICKCDCGNITSVKGSNLKNNSVKSCGCLLHQSPRNKTHGESKTKLYRHWLSMIYRCHKPKHKAYKWYGARGIKVCEDWHNFEKFKNWVLSTRPDESYTCERVDVNGDYCPENCIWIPLNEQANNRRTCIYITYNGKTQNLMQWCKELDLNYKLVHNRMYKCGYDFEKAIKTPKKTVKSNS